tara:strand:- start:111 stop:296 length:186 start_codon:yes stop_codon:yes gene_type:complete
MMTNIRPKCFGTVRSFDPLDSFVATIFPIEEKKSQKEQERRLVVPVRPQDKINEISNIYRK